MRLLWMKSDYVIPPDTGGKIRTYNLLRELYRLCDVTYLSFKSEPTPNTEPAISTCAHRVMTVHKQEEKKSGPRFYLRVIRGMTSKLPYIIQKYRSTRIVQHQRDYVRQAGEPAVVLCDFLEMAENVDWRLPCPKVLFQHNVESLIWQRYFETETHPLKRAYFNFERKRMAKYETDTCNRFDLVFTVSEEDRQLLKERGVTRPMEVLETGVDADFFRPTDQAPVPARLVFLGSLDWMPNIDGLRWFVHHVYPLIRRRQPAVTLDIVGRRPGPEVLRLADGDSSIRIASDVADVRPYISDGEVFVVPLRIGGGSRIKIYEAMSMSRAVVSTTIGAEGLPLQPDHHIAIGDHPSEFAEQALRLLANQAQRDRMAQSGCDLVTQHYQWRNVAMKLRDHCQQLTQAI